MFSYIIKTALLIFIIILVLVVLLALQIFFYSTPLSQTRYDTAIVLGAAVYNQRPSPVFKARLDHAITLYRQGMIKHIIFTGGVGEGDILAESEVAALYAIEAGMPASAIIIERTSRTTFENLVYAK